MNPEACAWNGPPDAFKKVVDHKVEKLEVVRRVLGVEAMRIDARSDVYSLGLVLYEAARQRGFPAASPAL